MSNNLVQIYWAIKYIKGLGLCYLDFNTQAELDSFLADNPDYRADNGLYPRSHPSLRNNPKYQNL